MESIFGQQTCNLKHICN